MVYETMHYRFGPFELDVDGYRLTREGEVVPVEPRVLEVLAYLIAHRDRLVDKEELVREVWGDAFVSDGSISRTVSEARAALGDTGEEQRWIATIYGRGYRFIAEVEERATGERAAGGGDGGVPVRLERGSAEGTRWQPAPGEAPQRPGSAGRERRTRQSTFLLGFAVLGLLAAMVSLWALRRGTGSDASAGSSPEVVGFQHLSSMPGRELYPSLSPDARYVAYASPAAGNWDVYLLRVGGSHPVNLTAESPADDTHPAFSPDGDQLAFRSEREGGGIFVMGATGESVRRLTREGFHPAWSPDGLEIAYTTISAEGWRSGGMQGRLRWVRLDTGESGPIGSSRGFQPEWSSDGRRVAFWGIGVAGSKPGTRNVWTVARSGGDPIAVTDSEELDWNPVYSPAGDRLYFVSHRAGSADIWSLPLDPRSGEILGEARAVTRGVGVEPRHLSVSADGRRLAYAAYTESTDLQRASFDPTSFAVGRPSSLLETSTPARFAAISPDGRSIAFETGTVSDIAVMDVDGGDLRRLTDDGHRDLHPRWSPDARRLAFFSNRSGSYEIWTIRPDGSELVQLTDEPERIVADPVWAPDGDHLAFIHMEDRTSYVAELEAGRILESPVALPPVSETSDTFGVWSWSPDGERIAGQFYGPNQEPAGIGYYSLGSERYTRLADAGAVPTWLSDGHSLVFLDEGRLHLVDTESGERRLLLDLSPGRIADLSIDPSERAIYFTLIEPDADLWLLKLSP